MAGWYYLHTNGSLIYKRALGDGPPDGPFVRRTWPMDPDDRGGAWLICIEALALGANRTRVMELANLWGLTDDDAQNFVANATGKDGAPCLRLFMDGDTWCATLADFVDLQESQAGFGATCLEALAELAAHGLLSTTASV